MANPEQNNPQNIKIFIVDDHEVVRQGLKTIFQDESDFHVVGESDGSGDVVETIRALSPDIVLLDIRIEGNDGFQIAQELTKNGSHPRVIVVTGYESELYVAEALRYKLCGFIPKGSSKKFICNAIQTVASGGTVWHGELLFQAVRNMQQFGTETQADHHHDTAQLTHREAQVLTKVTQGKLNKEIGKELSLSLDTVKKVIHSLKQKYGAANRTQLAIIGKGLKLD